MIVQLPFTCVQKLQETPQSAPRQHLCHILMKSGRVIRSVTVTDCQNADIPPEEANFGAKDIIDVYVVPT